jgi:glycosyltransferase involved in cell wall biosynthesis
VLHDLVLHHSRLSSYLNTQEVSDYRSDMGDSAKRARALARLADYEAEVEAAYPGRGKVVAEIALRMGGGRLLYEYPLFEPFVRQSLMTLVHSAAARDRVRESCPGAKVRIIRMGVDAPPLGAREEARRRLGLGPELVLASFGLITPEKRISAALGSLRRLLDRGIEARYFLVGAPVPHYDAVQEAERLGVASSLQVIGRASEEDFWLYACAADLCLNLRYPSAGETSATLLRLLAAGKPVLVTDQQQQLELPEDVVARVSLGGEAEGLFCDLMDLIREPERLQRLGRRAREFALAEHSAEAMARDYLRCLEEAARLLQAPPRESHPPS